MGVQLERKVMDDNEKLPGGFVIGLTAPRGRFVLLWVCTHDCQLPIMSDCRQNSLTWVKTYRRPCGHQ
jgi:hypothetical protein